MKSFLRALAILVGLVSFGWAADMTSTVNTQTGQLYNKMYKDVKDGTNAETFDNVSANSFSLRNTSGTIKTTPGYLDSFTYWAACQQPYIIADSTSTSFTGGFTTVYSTFMPTATGPVNVRVQAVFSNGITFMVPVATCPVTANFR